MYLITYVCDIDSDNYYCFYNSINSSIIEFFEMAQMKDTYFEPVIINCIKISKEEADILRRYI